MTNRIITTFMLPSELETVADCNVYIDLCTERRDSYAKLIGRPNKQKIDAAWNQRIIDAKIQREKVR